MIETSVGSKEVNWVEVLFDCKKRAGLRGDPHLWQEIETAMTLMDQPETVQEFEKLLFKILDELGVDINSPDDRNALLEISCDWWANAYINGQLVKSKIARDAVKGTGAEFTTDTRVQADIKLKKGLNTLLVKSHGGTGGNRFTAFITNPGDLTISATK